MVQSDLRAMVAASENMKPWKSSGLEPENGVLSCGSAIDVKVCGFQISGM